MSEVSVFSELKEQAAEYARTLGRKAINSAEGAVDKLADRFDGPGSSDDSTSEAAKAGAEKIAEGESPAKAAVSAAGTGVKEKAKGLVGADNSGAGGSGGGAGSGNFKFTNIVEWTDVGVPVSVAYNAFTEYENWPTFMKKVENVEWTDDVKLSIKGQVMWSHRTWEATISEQVADSHIVWDSTGEKGSISGSVTFHELAPRLTRMVVIGEYHPQGFVEKTANIWRAVGRRFRLELKFYVHHVMRDVIRDPDSVEGWRGEIRGGELVTSHDDALEQEAEAAAGEPSEDEELQDDAAANDESDDEQTADEFSEDARPEDDETTDEEGSAPDEDASEDDGAEEGPDPDEESTDEDDEDVEYEYVDVPSEEADEGEAPDDDSTDDETTEDRDGRA